MIQRKTGNRYILIGIVVTVLVVLLGLFFMTRGSGGGDQASGVAQNQASATSPVVVSLQAIPQGTTFRVGQPLDTYFTVKDVPASLVPLGAYASVAQIENVIKGASCQPVNQPGCAGQITTTQTIYQNLPVVSGMFSTLGLFRTQEGPAYKIPYGYVALSIDLSEANSVSGSIQPGDTVDLMASYNQSSGTGEPGTGPRQTQYVMTNVKVIGIGTVTPPQQSGSTSSTSTAPASAATTGSLVILARYQQALVVQHLKDFGWQISAVLRSARATASIPHFKTEPVTDRWYFVKPSNPFRSNPGY